MGPRLRSAKARLSKDVPTVTYDDLWYLYKPGDDIYLDRFDYGVLGARTACVLVSTEYGAPDNKPVDGLGTIGKSVQQVFRIHTWGSECNSTTASRHLFRCTLEEYKGEKEVKSLGSYPSRFQDSEDGGTFRQRLETRGEHYYKLVRTPPKQMWHDGSLYSKSMQQVRIWTLYFCRSSHSRGSTADPLSSTRLPPCPPHSKISTQYQKHSTF